MFWLFAFLNFFQFCNYSCHIKQLAGLAENRSLLSSGYTDRENLPFLFFQFFAQHFKLVVVFFGCLRIGELQIFQGLENDR